MDDVPDLFCAAEVLTPADEFELFVRRGVVPSTYAIRRALDEDRHDVLARLGLDLDGAAELGYSDA